MDSTDSVSWLWSFDLMPAHSENVLVLLFEEYSIWIPYLWQKLLLSLEEPEI